MSEEVRTRRWTRKEYDRLIELGLLQEDEPIELVGGRLVVSEPQHAPHATAIRLANRALRGAFPDDTWEVNLQLPIALDEESEPEPDVSVVPGAPRDYLAAHPTRPVLVVEVSDSTLRFDRHDKGSLYARAGIDDYWIVNLVDDVVEVYREPGSAVEARYGWAYRSVQHLRHGASVAPLAAPTATIAVADLLPLILPREGQPPALSGSRFRLTLRRVLRYTRRNSPTGPDEGRREGTAMRHVWMVVVLSLIWLPSSPAAAQDKPIELKFSSWVSAVHGHHTGVMVPWAKMVEEKSGGRLKITLFPGGTLGKPADHYDMIKDGIADMGFTTPGYTPGRFPLITVTELPLGLFKSSRGGSLAVMSVFDKHFKNEFKDVKVLWFWVHPPGHFHLAKKQVKVLEDLNGLKIRSATPMLSTMVKTLGATPVSIPAPDTYTALERGTVDGTIFPWEAISSFKIAEVLKYHVASGLYVAPLFTFMNQKKYDSLPPDLRKVIDDLSGTWGAEFNGKVWDQNELVGIEAIKKAGGTIYTLPAEERQRWLAKLKPMEEEWLKSMEAKGLPGRQLLSDLREAIKKYDP